MYGTHVHLPNVFQETVDHILKNLKGVEFDTVVCRGFSGAVIAPTVAMLLDKPWALIRKPNDVRHSFKDIEGEVGDTFIIVDDFIDSGLTIIAILDSLPEATCVGVVPYKYNWCNFQERENLDWLVEHRLRNVPILWSKYDSFLEERNERLG